MLKSKVIICANSKSGLVATPRVIKKGTPEEETLYSVMVKQAVTQGLSRIGNTSNRVAFLSLNQATKDIFEDSGYLVDGFKLSDLTECHIVIKETLTPWQYKSGPKQGEDQPHKIYPAGHSKAGQDVLFRGQKVYRNSAFSEDMSEQDVLLRESTVTNTVEATVTDTQLETETEVEGTESRE